MLANALDPDVAERPEELVASGWAGKMAADWEQFHTIVKLLRGIGARETLLVEAGRAMAVLPSRPEAPRVLVSGADWGWVGTQGWLPTAYELLRALADKHFGGTLAGRLVVGAGMGGAGGAQSLAATWLGGAFLGIDADAERIKRRVKAGYCETLVTNLSEALRILKNAVRKREPASVGLTGNCADVLAELAHRGVVPDLLLDQTPLPSTLGALDDEPAHAYQPFLANPGRPGDQRHREAEPERSHLRDAAARHLHGLLDLTKLGAVTLAFSSEFAPLAREMGLPGAEIARVHGPTEYLEPILYAGRAPMWLVALSGESSDIGRVDALAAELFPHDERLKDWLGKAGRIRRFQGLPVRVVWMPYEERVLLGRKVNELVSKGEMKAPLVVASATPYPIPETGARGELMRMMSRVGAASWLAIRDPKGAKTSMSCGSVLDGGTEAAERVGRMFFDRMAQA